MKFFNFAKVKQLGKIFKSCKKFLFRNQFKNGHFFFKVKFSIFNKDSQLSVKMHSKVNSGLKNMKNGEN